MSQIKLLNKETSWIRFNQRVLEQAQDMRLPLAERIKFLGIYNRNLDEFFMKRIGGLKRQSISALKQLSDDGKTPIEQIQDIKDIITPERTHAARYYSQTIIPELIENKVILVKPDDTTDEEKMFLTDYFDNHIFPLLTPYAVDAGHPFPMISNLSTSLGALLESELCEEPQFVRLKVSHIKPYWVLLPSHFSMRRFVSVIDVIMMNLNKIFPLYKIVASTPFRITRNADLAISDDEAEDLLDLVEQELKQRRFAQVVRLEHQKNAPKAIIDFLTNNLNISDVDVYESDDILDYSVLSDICDNAAQLPHIKPWRPLTSPTLLEESSLFPIIRYKDLIVHHPYDSFRDTTERFLREAVEDEHVQTIKLTLYRTSENSSFIPLLIQAAAFGKNVVCMVELKARFDEERNIQWAQTLEDAGVHVIYGIPGLKIHSKLILVVRKENAGVNTYAHIGTGNYNATTADLYTDYGLFTAKSDITAQLHHLFNYITGRSMKQDYHPLLVAPMNMKKRLLELIEEEILCAREGKKARIIAKMNGLDDEDVIEALYNASEAGVRISLIVRGICCLQPQVTGQSSNIEVISILDRFLEHTRVWYFSNGEEEALDGKFFMGSADWMQRNLHRRVELVTPVHSLECKIRCHEELQACLHDRTQAWLLQSNGYYIRRIKDDNGSCKKPLSTQEYLMKIADQRYENSLY